MSTVIRLSHALGFVESTISAYRRSLTHELAAYLTDHGEMSDQVSTIIRSHLEELESLEQYIAVALDTIAGDK